MLYSMQFTYPTYTGSSFSDKIAIMIRHYVIHPHLKTRHYVIHLTIIIITKAFIKAPHEERSTLQKKKNEKQGTKIMETCVFSAAPWT